MEADHFCFRFRFHKFMKFASASASMLLAISGDLNPYNMGINFIAPRHSRGAIFCHLFREMRKYRTKAQLWCNILSSLQTWRLKNVDLDKEAEAVKFNCFCFRFRFHWKRSASSASASASLVLILTTYFCSNSGGKGGGINCWHVWWGWGVAWNADIAHLRLFFLDHHHQSPSCFQKFKTV